MSLSAHATKTLPVASYMKVKQLIRKKICSGEWQTTQKIPSETELTKFFGYSRMTINRALRELTNEGLLFRLQGVGTFVASPKGQSTLIEIKNIADEIIARHNQHLAKIIKLCTIKANKEQASYLNLAVNTGVYHSLIVHYENNIPIQIEDRYVNATLVPNYLQQDFSYTTPHIYLSQIAPLSAAEHTVEAVLVEENECKLLQIHSKEPCLLVKRRTWSNNMVVSYTRLIFPGSRHRLKGSFQLSEN